jgi:glycosyltransferase involved in cell wall biosynthesis
MKTSVLIIAHNEEKHIKKCISSILNQTQKPDEIVLITHNCTDKTVEIAKKYSITIIPFNGPTGIVSARIKGVESVTGDIILCTDGDSFVEKNWVEIMSKTLQENNNVLVGSWGKWKGTFVTILANPFNKYRRIRNKNLARWIWGPSFAFYGKDKELVKNIYKKSIELSEQLKLSRNPEDLWLALFMKKHGGLAVTNKTHVTIQLKEKNSIEAMKRNIENLRNGSKIGRFF